MREWKKGDEAWIASFSHRDVERQCPICFGQRTVRVILGDETIVQTPCDYCGKGYEWPRGYVIEDEREPRAEPITITSVTSVDGEVKDVRYRDGYCASPGSVFATEEEAIAHARELEKKTLAEEAQRSDWGRRNTVQTLSWSIGYHMREAKEGMRRAEYHGARAVTLKGRKAAERAEKALDAHNAALRAEVERLEEKVRRIQSACGLPDPAEACRVILAIAAEEGK